MNEIPGVIDKRSLSNIPHMLRHFASLLESGPHGVDSVVLIAVREGDSRPIVYQFGKERSRLKTIGALNDVVIRMLKGEKE